MIPPPLLTPSLPPLPPVPGEGEGEGEQEALVRTVLLEGVILSSSSSNFSFLSLCPFPSLSSSLSRSSSIYPSASIYLV